MIFLSIIIPVRNEEKFIESTLHQLINQDYPKDSFELLVVDGMSEDGTKNIVKNISRTCTDINLTLLENPKCLSSSARNIGVRRAKGEIIAVIDGHVFIPDKFLFKNIERIVKENNAVILSRPAPLDVPSLKSGKSFWIAVSRKTWLGHSSKSHIYGETEGFVNPVSSGFAYHKSLFEKVGCFDETFDAAEDVEFHFRLKKSGYLAYTSPALLIYSYPRSTFWALFKQQTRYGEGRVHLIKKFPEAFTFETLIPFFIFVFFLLSPLILIPSAPFVAKIIWLSIALLYLGILVMTGLFEAQKRKCFLPFLWVVSGILVTHFGLGWGISKGIFMNFSRRQ